MMLSVIGLSFLLAGFAAAIAASYGEPRFVLAAPVATLIGVAFVHADGKRSIPESGPRASGMAATVLMAAFVPAAIVAWLVVVDSASPQGAAEVTAFIYGILAVVYGLIALWRAMGVLFGWI